MMIWQHLEPEQVQRVPHCLSVKLVEAGYSSTVEKYCVTLFLRQPEQTSTHPCCGIMLLYTVKICYLY